MDCRATVMKLTEIERLENQPHYLQNGLEATRDVLKSFLTEEEYRGYLKGRAILYLLRAGRKNGLDDYRKALTMVTWLIEEMEASEPASKITTA